MRPSLNEDVLDQIFQFCPNSTLAVLCQVSSDTRSIGWRHMCRTVTLPDSHRRLCAFLKFIVGNTHNAETGRIWGAGTHVLQLNIRKKSIYDMNIFSLEGIRQIGDRQYSVSQWAPHLTHALTLMPQLLSFSLKDSAEEIASHSPQFAIALGNHPSLTCLELCPIGPLLSNQLERAADSAHNFSKLRGIEFSLNPGQQDQAMWRFLFLYRDRLTKVVSSNWDLSFLIHNGNLHPEHNAAMVFSNVVHLQLESCSFSIQAIATLFPAVKTLSIPKFRLVTQPNSHVHFANLVSVQGDWNILVILFACTNLSSYIRRLAVSQRELDWPEGPLAELPDSDPRVFCGVLSASLRSLEFKQPRIRSLSWWTIFSRTIPCLINLEMKLGVKPTDLHLLCNEIPGILSSTPLVCVSLNLSLYLNGHNEEPGVSLNIALSYATNIPTLGIISISQPRFDDTVPRFFPEEAADLTKWWIVNRVGPSVDLVSIQENEEKAMKRMYLEY